jgi:glycosyltransferase involved in cell wall biosynthesis
VRIAMIGQRGIPASFGGVEHHVEELGSRLAARGHDVTVYSRTNYARERHTVYRGMRPRYLPTVNSKHLDAIVHSTVSTIDAVLARADIVHYHAVGPGIPAVLPRYLSRAKVVLTVHGLDAERAKWSAAARGVLRAAQWLSARVPDATIVVSKDLEEHYRARYRRKSWYIPNGVDEARPRPPQEIRRRFGLAGGDYLLFVGRLVPEKAPDLLIEAFSTIAGDMKLVLAGGSSFTDDFVRRIHGLAASDPRVRLTGYVYGELLDELYTNAAVFVLPSLLEGLPLTLLEAISYGIPVVASDIPPHREVLGTERELVLPGDERALAAAITTSLEHLSQARRDAEALRPRILSTYRWEATTAATEALYEGLLAEGHGDVRSASR